MGRIHKVVVKVKNFDDKISNSYIVGFCHDLREFLSLDEDITILREIEPTKIECQHSRYIQNLVYFAIPIQKNEKCFFLDLLNSQKM